MLSESARRNPFAGIRIRELCERADYSTGAFYAHWPNAGAFFDELSDYFMGEMLVEDFDELTVVAQQAARQPGAAAVLDLAEEDLRILLANDHWDAVELLNLSIARTTHRASATRGYRTIDEITARTYDVILERLGREPRPPLTSAQIGATLQALVEGFAFRSRVDPEGIEVPGGERSSLYAYAVTGALCALTRPIGDDLGLEESLAQQLRPPKARASRGTRARPS
jgi:AcrR family transcriptional regulator